MVVPFDPRNARRVSVLCEPTTMLEVCQPRECRGGGGEEEGVTGARRHLWICYPTKFKRESSASSRLKEIGNTHGHDHSCEDRLTFHGLLFSSPRRLFSWIA